MRWGARQRQASGRETAPGRLLPWALRWPAAVVLVACAAVTAGFGVSLADKRQTGWLDSAADARIQSAFDQYPPVLRFLVNAGTLVPVVLMTAALVLACALTRRWTGAVLAAVVVPAAVVLAEFVLKPLIGRTMLGALSFPSGHVTAVFALAGACAVLLVDPPGHRVPGPARLLLACAALLAASAVAVAIVAQAAHYFSDAVGGAAVGIGVVLACALTLDFLGTRLRRGPAARPPPGG
jgi:membrane-associated phospholipid phosphatase